MDKPRDLIANGKDLTPGMLEQCLVDAEDYYTAIIDLRYVGWIEPYSLVALAVFVQSQTLQDRLPRLTAPYDHTKANYLARMGVGEMIVSFGGQHDLPHVRRNDVGSALLELKRFDSEEAADELAVMVYDKVVHTDPVAASALHQSISELGQNVEQHSGRSNGFIAAQTTFKDSRVTFAIGDAGMGLLGSLQAMGFGDDEDVLEAVMLGGVTSTGDAGRGNGFRTARDLLTGKGGSLYAQTGVASRKEFANGRVDAARHPGMYVRGTLLQGAVDY